MAKPVKAVYETIKNGPVKVKVHSAFKRDRAYVYKIEFLETRGPFTKGGTFETLRLWLWEADITDSLGIQRYQGRPDLSELEAEAPYA